MNRHPLHRNKHINSLILQKQIEQIALDEAPILETPEQAPIQPTSNRRPRDITGCGLTSGTSLKLLKFKKREPKDKLINTKKLLG